MNNNHYKPATAPEHPIYKGDSISAALTAVFVVSITWFVFTSRLFMRFVCFLLIVLLLDRMVSIIPCFNKAGKNARII